MNSILLFTLNEWAPFNKVANMFNMVLNVNVEPVCPKPH